MTASRRPDLAVATGPDRDGAAARPAAGATHGRYLETARFGALDGVRGLSILAVIWHHGPKPAGARRSRTGASWASTCSSCSAGS